MRPTVPQLFIAAGGKHAVESAGDTPDRDSAHILVKDKLRLSCDAHVVARERNERGSFLNLTDSAAFTVLFTKQRYTSQKATSVRQHNGIVKD